MFCINCGNKLEEGANFCTNCGSKVNQEYTSEPIITEKSFKVTDVVEDNTIQLVVKPTFKFGYEIAPFILFYIIVALAICIPMFALGVEVGTIGTLIGIGIALVILIIQGIFGKKQYERKEYTFYRTKAIFKDSFLDFSEKEVKYKYIREVTMRQSLFQRACGLGSIYLFTNAESGMGNGLCIGNIENVQQVYKEIKELVKI